jgi:hypothetical protein
LRPQSTQRIVATAMAIRTRLLALLLLLAVACAAPRSSLDTLWADYQAEAQRTEPLTDPDAEAQAALAHRVARARELADTGALVTARDFFRASVLIVGSSDPADWPLAAELGNRAAEMGEPLGLRVAAEAIDKDLISQRQPQRYGTQFYWDSKLRAWRLNPVDPETTDDERAAMGVPSYAELIAAEVALNYRVR